MILGPANSLLRMAVVPPFDQDSHHFHRLALMLLSEPTQVEDLSPRGSPAGV